MSERGKFEEEWGAAFEGAHEQPSNKVWSEVKAELATLEADKQKVKVIYWRRFGIAASVAFLALLGGYYLANDEGFVVDQNQEMITLSDDKSNEVNGSGKAQMNEQQVSESANQASLVDDMYNKSNVNNEKDELNDDNIIIQSTTDVSETNKSKIIKSKTITTTNGIVENEKTENDDKSNNSVAATTIAVVKDSEPAQSEFGTKIHTNEISNILFAENNQSSEGNDVVPSASVKNDVLLTDSNSIEILSLLTPIDSLETLAVLNSDIYLQRVPDLTELFKYKKKNDFKNLWAGLSMGGGSFNPNVGQEGIGIGLFSSREEVSSADFGTLSVQENDTRNNILNNESTESPAFAYRFSVDFGKQLSRRFLIESGVEYAQYSSEATSNLTSNKNQTNEAFLRNTSSDFSYNDLQNTSTYKLSNNYEYISIPVSLGYVVLDKRVGVLLSSGFSADMFLSNKLKDESNQHATVTQKSGADSPYRPVNINALLGGEVYYSWSENYIIAIDPGYRFSLTGITKPDANFSSRPTSFFVALKFKYIL